MKKRAVLFVKGIKYQTARDQLLPYMDVRQGVSKLLTKKLLSSIKEAVKEIAAEQCIEKSIEEKPKTTKPHKK